MQYELVVSVEREAYERFAVTVEADDPEEAQDLVYDFFTDYPDSDVRLVKCLKDLTTTNDVNIVSLEFKREETIADKVFNDDDGDSIA